MHLKEELVFSYNQELLYYILQHYYENFYCYIYVKLVFHYFLTIVFGEFLIHL